MPEQVRVIATTETPIAAHHEEIDAALFASGDREMLQDLTAAAVNAAIASAQRLMQEEMQKASSALGLPLAGGAKPG